MCVSLFIFPKDGHAFDHNSNTIVCICVFVHRQIVSRPIEEEKNNEEKISSLHIHVMQPLGCDV